MAVDAKPGYGSPLLVLAIYILLFSTLPGVGLLCQLTAIAALVVDATLKLLAGRVVSKRMSVLEGVLLGMGVLSMVTTSVGDNTFAAGFSVAFVIAVLALMALARSYRIEAIIQSLQTAFVLMIFTTLAVYSGEVSQALLSGGVWYYRFTPFGLHPNLTGFIFGGGCVLFVYRALELRGLPRIVMGLCGVACVAFILAASARGGLLAAGVALLVVMARRASAAGSQRIALILLLAVLSLPLVFLLSGNAYSYLASILELNSATRGWDSGGTGRFERWQLGLSTIFDNPTTLLFGNGLRSTDGLTLGFSIESSYINIVIECGLLFGVACIANIWRLAWAHFPRGSVRSSGSIAAVMLFYALLQSIVNRYLLAIGNPLSIVLLLLAISLSVQRVQQVSRRIPEPQFRSATSRFDPVRRGDAA